MPIDQQLLSEIELFDHNDDEDKKALASVVERVQLRAGEILFEKGDPGDSLYIVRSGRIELFIRATAGEKIVLTVAEENDLFGELAMLDKGARSATAIAIEDSELIGLDRDKLLLLFQRKPDAALDMIGAMGGMIRKADDILRTRASKNVNEEVEERLTTIERVADWISWFSGSMHFLTLNTAWFLAWITINTFEVGFQPFDPYPFSLLTMIVSLEAIFLSIFVLISQNRQSAKDRIRSNVEYEVNVKAELEIAHLHDKTDRLQEKTLEQFARLEKLLAQAKGEFRGRTPNS